MKRVLILFTVVGALVLAGCSGAGSTHRSSNALWTNRAPGNVSQMPSGFRNVASKCVKVGSEWFAVFATSDGDKTASGLAAVPDPSCGTVGLGDGR